MIADTEKFIDRFRSKATKAVQVQSRIKQLDKVERLEIEKKDTGAFRIAFPPAPRSGAVVVKSNMVTKKYGDKTILKDIILHIERGHKIALVGKNGEGKSTFIKAILNEIAYEGEITLGHNVNLGYFAQNQDEILDENASVFDTLDAIAVGDIRTKIRDILGAFFFGGEDVDKKVKVLSGGERNRLAMAKLMLQPYNLLILDEPTNHLDIQSKAVLKQALQKYDGTIILVSHDRDFLQGLTTHIYEVKNTQIKEIIGDLQDYLNHLHASILAAPKAANEQVKQSNADQKIEYNLRKEKEKEQRKIQTQISKIEKEIETLEFQIEELNKKFIDNPTNILEDDFSLHGKLKRTLEQTMYEWEILVAQHQNCIN